MPKKSDPEDFTSVENKFKLSLLNMEKRFVELEVAISEMNEKVKAGRVESVKELNDRVSEIEDLILVEQAGLVELKSIMEKADNRFQTVSEFDKRLEKKVEDKISDLEKKVASAEEKESALNEDTEQRVSLIEQEIAQIKTRPPVESINPLEIGELRNKLKNLGKKMDLLESSVGTLKGSIDLKIKSSVEESLRGPTGKGVDFEFIKTRLDALKSGVDKLSDKGAATDMKLGEMEGKLSLIENRVRNTPKNTLEELKVTKRDLETAKVKIDSLERVVRELTSNLNEVETKAKKFQSLEQLTNLKKDVDNRLRRFKDIEEEISRLSNRVEIIYNELDKRMMGMRNKDKDIKRVSESAKEFMKDLEKIKFDMKTKADKKELGRFMNDVESRSKRIEEIVKEVIGPIGGAQKEGELPTGFKVVVSDLGSRMSEIEKALEMVQSSIREFSQRPGESIYDIRMKELIDKFVFLESRLSALEAMLQKQQPIILE